MAMAGHGLPLIGKALGHTSNESTQVYARLQLEPVRAAKQALSRIMLAGDSTVPPIGVDGAGAGERR